MVSSCRRVNCYLAHCLLPLRTLIRTEYVFSQIVVHRILIVLSILSTVNQDPPLKTLSPDVAVGLTTFTVFTVCSFVPSPLERPLPIFSIVVLAVALRKTSRTFLLLMKRILPSYLPASYLSGPVLPCSCLVTPGHLCSEASEP